MMLEMRERERPSGAELELALRRLPVAPNSFKEKSICEARKSDREEPKPVPLATQAELSLRGSI